MSIPAQIDRIIAARQEKIPLLNAAVQRVEDVCFSVDNLVEFRNNLPDNETELGNKLNSIVTDGFYKEYRGTITELDRLIKRFSRRHIHMSFVGKAGQGKSLVMQNISGLKGDVIPSSDGSDCTGAKSVITNSDMDTVSAEIEFYNSQEILDIVNKYLSSVFGNDSDIYQKYRVGTVSEIKNLPIEELEKNLDRKQGEASSKFKHLRNYIEHIGDFEANIGAKITVPASKIEEYVAQYKNDNQSVKYYKFLGVKGANIKCRFPYAECGKIVLVDTIGLGATSLGVEDGMRNAIFNDSDAIIYMFRPDSLRPRLSSDDFNIIDKIAEWVSPEYAKEMLFWVFNRVEGGKGENTKLIPEMMDEVAKLKASNGIAVCKFLDVNCLDKNKVEHDLLIPVLEQMSSQLEKIDRLLLDRSQVRLTRLQSIYQVIAEQLQGMFSKSYVNLDMRRHFADNIKKMHNAWAGQLRTYCLELKQLRNTENEVFSLAFNQTLNRIFDIPSLEQVKAHVMMGNKAGQDVFREMTDYMRLKIINDFFALDSSLYMLVRNLKSKIVHIMADENNGCGYLARVVPLQDDPDKWLEKLLLVAKQNHELTKIHKAIDSLIQFNLSVKGYLIYAVRNSLDKIDVQIKQTPDLDGLDDINQDIKAESIHRWLNRYIEDIYRQIRDDCQPYLTFPNNALFAAARDFLDRIYYAVDDLNATRDMQTEWLYFYEDHIPEIWSEECERHTLQSEQNAKFKKMTDKFKELNTKENFCI